MEQEKLNDLVTTISTDAINIFNEHLIANKEMLLKSINIDESVNKLIILCAVNISGNILNKIRLAADLDEAKTNSLIEAFTNLIIDFFENLRKEKNGE